MPGRASIAFFCRYWLPLICWMAVIFSASTDAFSGSRTSRFLGPIVRWFAPDLPEDAVGDIVFLVRKGAHVAEYALLSALFWRAFHKPGWNEPKPWQWRTAARAVLCSAIYAASDEWHQSFTPSRMGSPWDVLLDTAGAAFGMFIVWLACKWFGRRDCGMDFSSSHALGPRK